MSLCILICWQSIITNLKSMGKEQTVPTIVKNFEVEEEVQKLKKELKKKEKKNWKRAWSRGRKLKI